MSSQFDVFGIRASVVLVAAASALFTVIVSVTLLVEFAYRKPALHVAVETGSALKSLRAVALLAGGLSELRRTRLACIVQQGRRLMRQPDAPAGLQPLFAAAERSLDESRDVVASLARADDESLSEALTQTLTRPSVARAASSR